jgi:hypothetical protein
MRVLADLLYFDREKRENAEKYRFFGADGGSTRSVERGCFAMQNSTAE